MRKDTVAELRLLGFWAAAQNEPGRGSYDPAQRSQARDRKGMTLAGARLSVYR